MKRMMMGFCASLLALVAQAGEAPPPAVTQWYGLTVSGTGPYYRMRLPPEIYAASQRRDLGDVRILNGAGEQVPFSLEAATVPAPIQRAVLAPVNWFAVPMAARPAGQGRLGVLLGADGSLRAELGAPAAPRASDDTVLVDLGREAAVSALRIHLRGAQYQGRVRVESSADLTQWHAVGEAELLNASANGKQLRQERVALEGLRQRYLRLSWPDGMPEIAEIASETLLAEPVAGSGATPLRWQAAAQVRAGSQAGEYVFASGGVYPVESLRIDLPQPNTIAKVSLQSRDDAKAAWRGIATGTVFRLQGKSGEEHSAPLQFEATSARDWRILVDMRNGGLGSGLPQVSLGWRPAQLTFVARGSAPFRIGAGNAALTAVAQPTGELLMGTHPETGIATLGARLPMTQEKEPRIAASTRHIVLWMTLILAVATLGGIAWRLARSKPTDASQ
ncbi:DUF3999 domain-containing protein [Herbaspirillum sp. C9C3]|uniref:DUF3999 domain-containing protein n=1 Tax=Herbaspirillum sp. C9C3 TaxID=2735271 RepID=UPI001584E6E2|nr:DUF3999 domain-containing protein [Herbaspirillum sp. C9C3]NUT63082.1 DUF3999 domain-containing protein [Herbaspirillum sp. C9C3]